MKPDNIAEKFNNIYKGLERAHGLVKLKNGAKDSKGKLLSYAWAENNPVTIDIWKKHLAGDISLAIIPITDNATCWFGVIDIDKYDLDFNELENRLNKLNCPLVVTKSKSGGAHLTLFLKEETDTKLVRSKLIEWGAALGYMGVEIFPKQIRLADDKDLGNWITMPYSGADKSDIYAIHNGKKLTVSKFLNHVDKLRIGVNELDNFHLKVEGGYEDAPPCLQYLCQNGFPDGSKNNALFNMGVYAKFKYPDDWESMVEQYNQDYMGPGSSKEVQNIIKMLNKKKYFYKCSDQPICDYCNKSLCITRKYGIGTEEDSNPEIVIGRFVKIMTDPPTWIVDVQGHRMYMETSDFVSQDKFRIKCIDKINRYPRKIKAGAWQRLIDEKVKNCEELVAPKDAGPKGQLMYHIEEFCTNKASPNKEDLLRGKSYAERGRVHFRSSDLIKYLEVNRFRAFTERQIWGILNDCGGHHQFGIKGKNVQCWWVPEFEQQTEEFSIPESMQINDDEIGDM